jgi:SAM-dependent methyltransferase
MTAISPHKHIADIAFSYLNSAALLAAVELGVADRLVDGPKSAGALAGELGVKEQPLTRLLRLLATIGIFTEPTPGSFALTPAADVLRADAPGSMRDAVRMLVQEIFWAPAGQLTDIVRTGETPFARIFGSPFFDYLTKTPEAGAIFHKGMAGVSDQENGPIARAYDFQPFHRIVDVGGGHGGFLIEALAGAPRATGVLFDAPHVLRDARIEAAGLAGRVELAVGDFFTAVPEGDCIVLKRILHDWSDEDALSILRACRRSLQEGGRILVLDAVIQPGDEPQPGKILDVMMLVSLPGRERTAEDFARLFAAADLRLSRIVPTPTTLSIVEAVAA